MLGFDSIMRSFGVLTEAIENFKSPAPAVEELEEAFGDENGAERTRPAGAAGDAGVQRTAPETGLAIGVSKAQEGSKGTIVLTVDGAVDSSTSEEFEERLEKCLAENPAHLVLDLSNMVYIGSGGWGTIVKYMQKLGESGGKIAIVGMNSGILKIFRDLGFEPLIPHFGTLERALSELRLTKKLEAVARKERVVPESAVEAHEEKQAETPAPAGPAGAGEDLASALLGKADIIPLEPLKPVKDEEKVIFIDFKHRTDVRENKDEHIKKIGWEEYGKKLSESGKNPKRRKK